MTFKRTPLLVGLCLLSGCENQEQRTHQRIHDQVRACAANFSEDIQTHLQVASHLWNIHGTLSTKFKEQSQALLFATFPPSERLAAYQDYIRCIETAPF